MEIQSLGDELAAATPEAIQQIRGAPGRIRTADAGLRTASLYPLSYGGAADIVLRGRRRTGFLPNHHVVTVRRGIVGCGADPVARACVSSGPAA
jgi:hypothetical protein